MASLGHLSRAASDVLPESVPPHTVIHAVDLGKAYRTYARPQDRLLQPFLRRPLYREFHPLRGVTFDVEAGETVGIIGRNGAGKSTLLQIIAGTLAPTFGRVAVEGRVAALLELGSGFNPEFTGRENVYLNGSILGLSRREMDAASPTSPPSPTSATSSTSRSRSTRAACTRASRSPSRCRSSPTS